MTSQDPRAALTALIAALERHLDIAVASDGEDDVRLDVAEERLAEALEAYDDALFDAFGLATPFGVFEDDDEFDDDTDDVEEDFEDFDLLDDDDDLDDDLEDNELDEDELDNEDDDEDATPAPRA